MTDKLFKSITYKNLKLKFWNVKLKKKFSKTKTDNKSVLNSRIISRSDSIIKLIKKIQYKCKTHKTSYIFSPQGKRIDNKFFKNISKKYNFLIIYIGASGFDRKILNNLNIKEISFGDYIVRSGYLFLPTFIHCIERYKNLRSEILIDNSFEKNLFGLTGICKNGRKDYLHADILNIKNTKKKTFIYRQDII